MSLGDGTRTGLFLAAFFAAGAITTAFLPLWFADQGLTPGQIGQVLGSASLLRVFAVPGLGWVADAGGHPRLSLFAAASCAALCAALFPVAPGTLALTAVVALQGVASSSLAPLTDALTLALAAARRLDYGRTRAWGSVSYMLASAGGGVLLGRTGTGVVPFLLAGFYGFAAVLASLLPRIAAPDRAGRGLEGPLRSPVFRLALLASALIQGSHAAYYGFAGLHWRSAGIPDAVIGLLIAEGIVAEIALFIWGRRLAERLGPARLTGLAAAACVVRWTATAFVTAVPALAALQLLHAGTFAFQHLSAMMVLRGLPPERAGMAQALLAALGFAAPAGMLTWLSGRLYESAGGLTFLAMAALGVLAFPVAGALGRALRPAARSG